MSTTRQTPPVYENILETIGRTPLVKLHKTVEGIPGTVYAKVEYFNPGHSTKDRMALKMVEDAEKNGLLKPGGTIIECTSGNTGMGLALAAVVKGYKLICTLSDKQSKEKMDVLRALGAEIYVCPTNVAPDHPDSYYSVARRLNAEIPNSYFPNQYDNLSNREAHYETTGPEIWEQTEGKITHFIVGVGTGGTISGVAKYLKEKNPAIQIWGVDSYGSVFKKYHETGVFDTSEIYGYITEGIGEDILPKNVDFDLIDRFEKVTDRDGALAARELARQEGLLLGYSCGSALQGLRQLKDELPADAVSVILFHDHGSRYVGKIYNDDWMRERGFLKETTGNLAEAVAGHNHLPLLTIQPEEPLMNAVVAMKRHSISQLPVHDGQHFVGSITESHIIQALTEEGRGMDTLVKHVMGAPFPVLSGSASVQEGIAALSKEQNALLIEWAPGKHHILSKHDLLTRIA
ncbi:MAG: pyridoxal-phosphate dependent enzyme [Flavobacteriia bacterium]|jgi:cystathionine beta-synthase|nr:pyridoxal-phosphate dependent enzyme [Flavobacteriia bacterium]